MENLVSMLMALLIIYSVLIIFTILLLNKLYKSYLVYGIKTKEIIKRGSFNFSNGDSHDHVTSYFSFKTKNGKNINLGTSLFPMAKKGNKRFFFYNEDRNEIVAKVYTVVWQFFFFLLSVFYSLSVGHISFAIAILIIIITIWIYSKNYNSKLKSRNNKKQKKNM